MQDRVDIPQEEHPEINFIGILIGPRGNTLKKMEAESGAKIMVRIFTTVSLSDQTI